jgi:serine/threonine-protein kinase
MALSSGSKLGPYEILAPIGAGGMGEVYRARDPRMGREVAIKVAAERFSDRFSREVHAVAALNHPTFAISTTSGPTTW